MVAAYLREKFRGRKKGALHQALADAAGVSRHTVIRLKHPQQYEDAPHSKFGIVAPEVSLAAFGIVAQGSQLDAIKRATNWQTLEATLERIISGPAGAQYTDPMVFTRVAGQKRGRKSLLHPLEQDALDTLWEEVKLGKHKSVALSAPPHTGIGYLLAQLHERGLAHVTKFIHVRPPVPEVPDADGAALGDLMQSVAGELGLQRVFGASDIVSALVQQNAVLVIHNAHVFLRKDPLKKNRQRLSNLFSTAKKYNKHLTPLIFVTRDETSEWFREKAIEYDGVLSKNWSPAVPAKQAVGLIDEFMRGYASLLGTDHGTRSFRHTNSVSPSMRRLRWHLKRLKDKDLKIATLRLRAAAFLDRQHLSEADPTQGYEAFVGRELLEKAEDLRFLREDIRWALRAWDGNNQTKEQLAERRGLRRLSTGVYWFSKHMNAALDVPETQDADHASKLSGSGTVDDNETWQALLALVVDRTGLVYQHLLAEGDSADISRLAAPLALRLVIQDNWLRDDPEEYAATHIKIAKTLEAKKASDLAEEYPFRIPFDSAKTIFRSEAIRHYVRAARGAPDMSLTIKQAERLFKKLDPLKGAKKPAQKLKSAGKHILSRSSGRYYLKLELLHLLSEDGRGLAPHPALADSLKKRFYRELGISRMSLLHVQLARDAFAQQAGKNVLPRSEIDWDCLLHLISVTTVAQDFDEAKELIETAERALPKVPSSERIADIRQRIDVRWANLAFAKGNLGEAYECYMPLLNHSAMVPIEGDRAFACIDVLLASARLILEEQNLTSQLGTNRHERNTDTLLVGQRAQGQTDALQDRARSEGAQEHQAFLTKSTSERHPSQLSLLSLALTIAEANIADPYLKLRPHEALRFEFRKAIVHSLLGNVDVAEVILDRCLYVMAERGGSSRALHELRMAAGETLMQIGWDERAFFGYLLPALRLADDRGANQYARSASVLAQRALSRMVPRLLMDPDKLRSSFSDLDLENRLKRLIEFGPSVENLEMDEINKRRAETRVQRSKELWSEIRELYGGEDDPFYGIDFQQMKRAREEAPAEFATEEGRVGIKELIEKHLASRSVDRLQKAIVQVDQLSPSDSIVSIP